MKAVFKWTLWQRRWSTMWWSIASFFLIFINMIFYPSFKNQAAELQKSFENLPEATLQFIGGSSDFFSPVGFLNSQIFFLMMPLLLGVLAISLGSSLLAREEQDRTIEALLARPLSRGRLLAAKALSGVVILSCATLVGLLTTLITAKIVNLELGAVPICLAALGCLLLVLSFGAIAFAFTATGKARMAAVGASTTVALGGYIINSLAGTVSWLEMPSKVFPFHYYQPEAILTGAYNWINISFPIGLVLAASLVAWTGFRQRDIG